MKLFFSIFLFSVMVGAYLYPQLPPSIPTHWNSSWEADSYLPKSIGFIAIPVIMLWLGLLLYNIPNIDSRVRKFGFHYELFIIILMLFLAQFHVQMLLSNIGLSVPLHIPVSLGSGILIFFLGVLLAKTGRNWFVGIRTPWALESDRVWEDTHWLASKLFMASGVIALLGVFYPAGALYLIVVPVLLSCIISAAYSYYEHKKSSGRGRRNPRRI